MKQGKQRSKYAILTGIFALSIIFISFKVFDDGDDFEIAKSFDIFHNAVREIRMFYVDDPDISKLINESTQEFLQKLDPYTVYFPESKMEDFAFMTTGSYGGIGAMISEREDVLLITDIYKGSVADHSGLKAGDEITEVNNMKITEENISQIKDLLKGEPGSEVIIKFNRFGESQPIKKTIKREKVELGNISYAEIVDNNIGFIKLDQFKQNAANDLKSALDKLNDSIELTGLILDLRGNPGGLLYEAVNIVSLFVKKGSDIVTTKGRVNDWNQAYKAKRPPEYPDLPIAVLMNSGSASASEIVAGALQDLDRAVIIGQRSFGKGLVQITRKMNYNTMIKLTTAKYYIPSGRCIQALDYSHRNPDGSVGHVPDSLISEFKTSNGRTVYDGGGIYPDIYVDLDSTSDFTSMLIRKYVIFDFATKYFYENKLSENVDEFKINDFIFNEFVNFTLSKDLNYESKTGILFNDLIKRAKKEKYDISVINKMSDLQKETEINIQKALLKHKEEILPFLASEIMSRYYYEEGKIRSFMNYDKAYNEAVSVLNDKKKYTLLLSSLND